MRRWLVLVAALGSFLAVASALAVSNTGLLITKAGHTCAQDFASPVNNQTWCFQATDGVIYARLASAWVSQAVAPVSGTVNVIPRYAPGSGLAASALTDDTTNVTTTRPLIVRMDSNTIAPTFTLLDTRAGSGQSYSLSSSGGDFFLKHVATGRVGIMFHRSGDGVGVGLAGADVNATAARPEGAVILNNMAELKIIIGGGFDAYPVLMLDNLDALQISQYTDLHIGRCSGSPAMPAWCDPGAGGRGSVIIHGGRDRSGVTGGADLTVFNENAVGANLGGALELGGRYDTTAPSASFAFLAGRKANATLGDVTGYLQIGTTNAAGTFSEKARVALGLMVGTTTDSGAGIINALNGYATNNTLGLTTTFDVLCDTTDPTKKRTITVSGGIVTSKGTCA